MLIIRKSHLAVKTFIKTLSLFLLITQICFAQWYAQNSGTTKNLNSVHFIDANTGWAVGESGTIIKTTNSGVTWLNQTSGTNHKLLDVQFKNINLGLAAGGTGEFWNPDSVILLKTTDGGLNWIKQLSIKGKFYDVCYTDEYNGHLVGSGEDIFGHIRPIYLKTTDGGNTWMTQYYNENFMSAVDFIDNNTGWLVEIIWGGFGCYGSVIRKTMDGGMNWEVKDTNYALYKIKSLNSDFIYGIGSTSLCELCPLISNLARTSDGGATWTQELVNGLYTRNGLNDISISSLNVLTAVGFWDSTYWGDLYGNVLRSTDSGNTWSMQIFTSTEMLNGVSFIDDYTGWIVGNNGIIFKTTNGGVPVELTSFTATLLGNEVILNWSTATEINNQGFEILRFAQDDSEWQTIGFVPGFGTTTEPKSYSYIDSKVSTGKYTYRLKQIDFDGSYEYSQEVEVEVIAPLVFSLEQNYPNPFNPSTVIGYHLPVSGDVTLKVFDIIGNEIVKLVDEYKPVGRYEVEFSANGGSASSGNAINLPNGVYFYQLKAGNYTDTKKMILLK
jgi:photosystem II stability/assembly factor-like uncharacterized protein